MSKKKMETKERGMLESSQYLQGLRGSGSSYPCYVEFCWTQDLLVQDHHWTKFKPQSFRKLHLKSQLPTCS